MKTNTNEQGRTVLSQGFGVADDRGREVGARAILLGRDGRPGFWPHATRAGKDFGAMRSSRFFATAELRDAAIASYFAGAAKRAAKWRQPVAAPDAECSACGASYFSDAGHPTLAICQACR